MRSILEASELSEAKELVASDKEVEPHARKHGGAIFFDDYKDLIEPSVVKADLSRPDISISENQSDGEKVLQKSSSKTVQVEVRKNQQEFREKVLQAYSSKCCVSQYDVPEALQAAHIKDYAISKNDDLKNGLCLRADIHILFDRGLIRINSKFEIEVDEGLKGTMYWNYSGSIIGLPKQELDWPSQKLLDWKYCKIIGGPLRLWMPCVFLIANFLCNSPTTTIA